MTAVEDLMKSYSLTSAMVAALLALLSYRQGGPRAVVGHSTREALIRRGLAEDFAYGEDRRFDLTYAGEWVAGQLRQPQPGDQMVLGSVTA